MSGSVMVRGLPHGGVIDEKDGSFDTIGTARHGLEFKEMHLVKVVGRRRTQRRVVMTQIGRVGMSGDRYRLVLIPFTENETIHSSLNRRVRVRPTWGEYLWADRSEIKPDNPSSGRQDSLVNRNNCSHEQWVREDRLEEIK